MVSIATHAGPLPGVQPTSPVMTGIMNYLKDRNLQAGDRLPSERDFADRLKVGRNAIREALATLVTLRVVESRPNSGIYLRHVAKESSFEALVMLTALGAIPTETEVAETMEVRAHLEQLSVSLACARRTDADLARLDAIVLRTEELLSSDGNIASMDTEFHLALVESTHNSVLVRVLNAFYQLTSGRRRSMFEDLDQGSASAREHKRLVQLVRARDTDKACRLILRHMGRANSYWTSVLGTHDDA